MRIITVQEYEAGLKRLASACGDRETFDAKRKAWEATVLVADEAGDPVDVSGIDVEIDGPEAGSDSIGDLKAEIRSCFDEVRRDISTDSAKAKKALFKALVESSDGVEFKRLSWGDSYVPRNIGKGLPLREAQDASFALGCFYRAVRGDRRAEIKLGELGYPLARGAVDDIQTKGNVEGVNSLGGFVVPHQMAGYLIRLVEDFGVFRRHANMFPMASDTASIPRRASGYTAHFVAEDVSASESRLGFDDVKLVAKKLAVLTYASNELLDDATIAIGDLVSREIALAMSEKEDDCGFNGDGTSTYGGMVGVRNRLSIINGLDDGGGLVLGSAGTWGGITHPDIAKLISIVPQFAGMKNAFYCSHNFYGQVLLRLSQNSVTSAFANVTATPLSENQSVSPSYTYLGFPIRIVQKMPKVTGLSQICLLFGDLSYSSTIGVRRDLVIRSSTEAYNAFEKDRTAFVAFHRFDIVNHDLGTATDAGPVVGLITAAS